MNRRDLLTTGAAAAVAPFTFSAAEAAQAAAPGWKPAVLDAHQNATVIVLTGLIIPATDTPGAKDANVNRYVDLLLHDGPDVQREHFFDGLNGLDGAALRQKGKPFKDCDQAGQIELLKSIEGTGFFRQLKTLTSRIYYATEIGFQELNKGGRVPATYGCTHPEHA